MRVAVLAVWTLGSACHVTVLRGWLMQWVVLAVPVAVAAACLGWYVRESYRNAPLRREWSRQPITFRTQLSAVKYPDSPWLFETTVVARGGRPPPELVVRGDAFRVGAPFGLPPDSGYYFRAPEATIELSRNPLRIYGVQGDREWIVVRGSQAGRQIQLSIAKKYSLDDVWNALIAAGAVPTSRGPSPQPGRTSPG
jgi:hypothetical protein